MKTLIEKLKALRLYFVIKRFHFHKYETVSITYNPIGTATQIWKCGKCGKIKQVTINVL